MRYLLPLLFTVISGFLFHFNSLASSHYFLSNPQLSPKGNQVFFTFDGDLWSYDRTMKQTNRLTNLSGQINSLKMAPDGEKIAFSATKYGQNDIFVLDLSNGTIQQLTYHDANDLVSGWSLNSEEVYFTSDRYNSNSSYTIHYKGGTARRIIHDYFNITNQLIAHPQGGYLLTTGMESTGQLSRKRYKGPNNPEIYHYDPNNKMVANLTQWEGKDLFPSVDESGNIYYQSDELNGINNLFVLQNGHKKALTHFETDISMPSVSLNGEYVTYIKDYQLYLYEVKTGHSQLLQPQLNSYRNLDKLESFNVNHEIAAFDVAPDGTKLAFLSRGHLFVSDIEGKAIKKALNTQERILEVKWLADNETVIFTQTVQGYPQIFILNVHDKNTEPRALTQGNRSHQQLSLNKKRTQAVYISGRDQLQLMNLKSFQTQTIVEDEFWAFQQSTPQFSPNNDYIVFTARRHFEEDLFAYHLASQKIINLTQTGVTENQPFWSPDGKYIYYTSNTTEPAYPYGLKNSGIYKMAIDWFALPFASDHLDEIFKEPQIEMDPIDEKKRRRKKDKEQRQEAATHQYIINEEGLMDRVELVSNRFGTQNNPFVTHLKEDQYVWYNSNQDGGKYKWYLTHFENYRKKSEKEIHPSYVQQVIEVQDKIYFLSNNKLYQLQPESLSKKEIKLDFSFYKNLEEEFHQMFEETWAGVEENFYSNDFHGVDWHAKKLEYQSFLPYIKNRNDLRTLLNDLLGELNASHLGFTSNGKEERSRLKYVTNEIGVVFDELNPFKIARIIPNGPAVQKPHPLQLGDIITHVNGIKVEEGMNRDSLFSFPELLKEIHLHVTRSNATEATVKIHPISRAQQRDLLYNEWIKNNEQYVRDQSQDEIAYVYMKNMSEASLEKFLIDMAAKDQQSKGLILDLRFNTGGNVHDKILQFLSQRPYLEWQYRNGQKAPQSTFAPSGKPIVLLINEGSLSDAEMTAAGFKALQLGTIIGKGTYRWIIFTSGKSLVDGSSFRVPAWGCYTLEGENLELTGVEPDIQVDISIVDRELNHDPQLERAIQEIKNKL